MNVWIVMLKFSVICWQICRRNLSVPKVSDQRSRMYISVCVCVRARVCVYLSSTLSRRRSNCKDEEDEEEERKPFLCVFVSRPFLFFSFSLSLSPFLSY